MARRSQIAVSKVASAAFLYGIVGLSGIWMMYYPTLLSGFTRLQADRGDTRLVQYFLEHSFQVLFVRNYSGSLWSPSFFYPFKNALAFSENLFGSAPLYWALRAFMAEDYAFQGWMMIVVWLCFVTFVIVLRQFRVSHALSALGGFLFAFGLPRAAQIGHHQLFPQFFMPIAFLVVWKFIQRPAINRLCWALLLIYLQILAAVYLGWFLVFSLLIVIPVVLSLEPTSRGRLMQYLQASWKSTLIAFLIWGIGVLWLFRPYLEINKLIGEKPYSEIASMLPRLTSWLLPPPQSTWGGLLAPLAVGIPMLGEHWLFLGFVVLALTGFAIYILRSRPELLDPERALLAKVCLITVLIIFVLSLSVFDHSLWWLIYKSIPGATSMRAVTRIALTVYFYLLLGVLLCLDAFLKRTITQPYVRTSIAIGLLLLTLPEQIVWAAPSFERVSVLKTEAELQELMSQNCDFAYRALDEKDFPYNQQAEAMWAGLRANVPVINGYSGANPPGLEMRRNLELSELLTWLHYASNGRVKGRLCLIQPTQSFNQPSQGMPISAIAQGQQFKSSAGHFTSFVIPVPPNTPLKQFSQAMRVITTPPTTLRINTTINLPVLVRNTGDFTWFGSGNTPVNFSYRWLNERQEIDQTVTARTLLPFDLPPNQAVAINARIGAPSRIGRYTLQLTMVQESVSCFMDQGAKSLDLPITVIKPPEGKLNGKPKP